MITRIEPASNSTQLTQLALDDILREFSDVSRLPMAKLQRSLSNEDSPVRKMYASLLAYLKTEHLCQERFKQLDEYKKALTKRKKQVQKLLVQQTDDTFQSEFKTEFSTSADLEKRIDDLEYKLTRLHNKSKILNKARIQKIQNYISQYEASRETLVAALNEKGYARFTEKELDTVFAELCKINEGETEND